jgi:hypothetical protein
MIINRSYITSLLRPGAHAIFANYNIYPEQWKEIYSQHISDKAVEYEIQTKELGIAQIRPEGSPTAMDDMREVFTSSYVNTAYGIGFQITRFAIEDNLYKDQFPQQMQNLRNSLATIKNVNGAYLFNNAFNQQNSAGSDGQPLLSTQHPTNIGTLANTFNNNVGLNEQTLEEAITIIKGWKNYAGLQINTNTIKLLVPQALAFTGSRLLNSQYRVGTTNNDINVLAHDKYMPGGCIVNQYLLNPNAWFILTDEPNGFKYFRRTALDIDFITDPNTDNVTVRAMERYAMGYSNWRCVFGSIGIGA